jgi:hypothetical protein
MVKRSIKTVSEPFLCHFNGNVNYLAWGVLLDNRVWIPKTRERLFDEIIDPARLGGGCRRHPGKGIPKNMGEVAESS